MRWLILVVVLLCMFISPVQGQLVDDTGLIQVIGNGRPYRLVLSPDEKRLLVLMDNGVFLLHLSSGQVTELDGHQNAVPATGAFTPDSQTLLTGDSHGAVIIRDVETGEQLFTFNVLDIPHSFYFNMDGTLAVLTTGTQSPGPIYLLNITEKTSAPMSNEELSQAETWVKPTSQTGCQVPLFTTASTTFTACSTFDGSSHILTRYDSGGNPIKQSTIDLPKHIQTGAAGQEKAYFFSENRLYAFDYVTNELSEVAFGQADIFAPVEDIAYRHDQMALATDNGVQIFNPATGEVERTLPSPAERVLYRPSGELIIAHPAHGVEIRDAITGSLIADLDIPFQKPGSIILSPDNSRLLVASQELFEVRLEGDTSTVQIGSDDYYWYSADYVSDGTKVVAVGISENNEFIIHLFHLDRQTEPVTLLTGMTPPIAQVVAYGNMVAAVGDHLWVWDTERSTEPRYVVPNGDFSGVTFSPDGKTVATLSGYGFSNTVSLFDVGTGDLKAQFSHVNPFMFGGGGGTRIPPIRPVRFSPDGTKIAARNYETLVAIFDTTAIPQETAAQTVIAYCDQFGDSPTLRADQPINLLWSWYAQRLAQVGDHVRVAAYTIALNGNILSISDVKPGAIYRDRVNDNDWTMYYVKPLGMIEPGTYTVQYRVTWTTAITDGYRDFGPGTDTPEETGTCTFTVE